MLKTIELPREDLKTLAVILENTAHDLMMFIHDRNYEKTGQSVKTEDENYLREIRAIQYVINKAINGETK